MHSGPEGHERGGWFRRSGAAHAFVVTAPGAPGGSADEAEEVAAARQARLDLERDAEERHAR